MMFIIVSKTYKQSVLRILNSENHASENRKHIPKNDETPRGESGMWD